MLEEEEEERRKSYFPIPNNYNGCSIVDALKSIGVNSSYNYRGTIAAKNGIDGYRGTPEQNTHMLQLLKSGKLLNPREEEEERRNSYFPIPKNYNGCSIVDALKSIGANSNYNYRGTIAAKNGIDGYCGTPEQNIHLLQLLKSGKLLRP